MKDTQNRTKANYSKPKDDYVLVLSDHYIRIMSGMPSRDEMAHQIVGSYTLTDDIQEQQIIRIAEDIYDGEKVTKKIRELTPGIDLSDKRNSLLANAEKAAHPVSVEGEYGRYTFIDQYLACKEEHISLDSNSFETTELCLSHWPDNQTPLDYRSYLSAISAHLCINDSSWAPGTNVLYTNHYDVDSLICLYIYLYPGLSEKNIDQLIAIAKCGDFYEYSDNDILIKTLALRRLPTLTSLMSANEKLDFALPYVSKILDNPGKFQNLWGEDFDWVSKTDRLFEENKIIHNEEENLSTFQIDDELDLGVFMGGEANKTFSFYELSDISFLNRAQSWNIFVAYRNQFLFIQKYQGWVDYYEPSLKTYKRVDLRSLCNYFNKLEGLSCSYDGVFCIRPKLKILTDNGNNLKFSTVKKHFLKYIKNSSCHWESHSKKLIAV